METIVFMAILFINSDSAIYEATIYVQECTLSNHYSMVVLSAVKTIISCATVQCQKIKTYVVFFLLKNQKQQQRRIFLLNRKNPCNSSVYNSMKRLVSKKSKKCKYMLCVVLKNRLIWTCKSGAFCLYDKRTLFCGQFNVYSIGETKKSGNFLFIYFLLGYNSFNNSYRTKQYLIFNVLSSHLIKFSIHDY